MRILGIDTANRHASAALIDDDKIIAQESQNSRDATARKGNHAEILIPLVDAIFSQSKFSLSDLSAIALSIGPGSFTGLRIGLATVKGLAYENDLPIVGVSSLQATAFRIKDSAGLIAAVLDARKSEVYLGLFRRHALGFDRLTEDRVTNVERAIATMRGICKDRGTPMLLTGDGAAAYEELFRQSLGSSAQIVNECGLDTVAACVARIGAGCVKEHSRDDLGAVTPLYLRPSEAETKLRKFA